ncbi:MAG: radical SAM protein [Bacteroidetes bacterium]|nr:radical SAM protein [Bacteroidota bacterium]
MEQLNLFEEEPKETKLGHASISYRNSDSILTIPKGFMEGYDFSLNPYSGCAFGCTYCYAAFFSRDKLKMDNWGYWVDVKENALNLLKKKRKTPIIDKVVYMSSVTDPYQPIERKIELTRDLMKEFADFHKIRLVIQTRSTLASRDIDLFKKIGRVQVNMTVTTDDETVRKVFEPYCPSNKARLKTIKEIHDAGIQSCITMTPLLPVNNAETFASLLKETGIENFIIQPFHKSKGKFIAGTRDSALKILNDFNWNEQRYMEVLRVFQKHIPNIGIGKEGFAPPL